jgi:FkbM family methyltransferase
VIHSAKQVIASAALKFGYTIIPTWSAHHLPLAMHLRSIFQKLQIDCVLDVGANQGQYKRFLRERVGYKGLVISFEPLPTLYRGLINTARTDPAWKVFGYALGANESTGTFNEMRDSQFSSFLAPDSSAVSSFVNQNTPANSFEIEIKSLDSIYKSLAEKYGFSRPFLKMDTQGYDLEVIAGAKSTLPVIPALQTEASVLPIYKNMPDYRTVIARLENEGYQLSTVASTNAVGAPYLVEFDCVMVRRSQGTRANVAHAPGLKDRT